MFCKNDAYASPTILLGSGRADDMEYANRFGITKTAYGTELYHYGDDYNVASGVYFNIDGTVKIYGDLRGSTGLFPIGYIYLSLDSAYPGDYFGGTWLQLSAVYLYATSDLSELGKTYENVLIDVQHEGAVVNHAKLIKVAAWYRVS